MSPTAWALVTLALLLGAVIGWLLASRRGGTPPEPAGRGEPSLPEGARELLDSLLSTAIVLDSANRVHHSTHHAADQGYVRDDTVPHQEIRELVEECRATGELCDREVEITRSVLAGGRFSVGCRVFPLGEDWIVILLEDRSRAQRVEEVRRDFVANVSHELKTPVGGIALLAEAVQDARDEPEAVERFARRMVKEAERLGHLVQEIVEFSRLQAGESLADPRPTDLAEVVRTAVDHVRVQAEGRQIDVRQAGLAHGAEHLVFGDPEMLTAAVRNLLVNAIAYSDPGTRVVVSVQRDPGADTVRIVVSDQGVGIPPEDLERIFERFYRVDAARSRHTGGTGLGLAIVKHVVAHHGGTISVWSRQGTGSTFTIELPVAEPDSAAVEGSAARLP